MIALLARLFLHNTKDEEAVRHGYGMICGCVGIVLNLILSCFKIVLVALIGFVGSPMLSTSSHGWEDSCIL